MRDDELYVVVEGTFEAQTDSAVLLRQGDDEFWFPKSQMLDPSEAHEFGRGTAVAITVTEWIAEQKGCDYDYE